MCRLIETSAPWSPAKTFRRDEPALFQRDINGLLIYDAFKLVTFLKIASASPIMNCSIYTIQPSIRPGPALVQLSLIPKGGGGETLEQIMAQGSTFQRLIRQIKADEKSVDLL